MPVGIQITAAEDTVGGTDCCRSKEVCFDGVIIILFERGSSKDGADLLLMLQPVRRCDLCRDLFDLICQAGIRLCVEGLLQHIRDHVLVLLRIVPEIRGAGLGAAFGIQDVKDIFNMPLAV